MPDRSSRVNREAVQKLTPAFGGDVVEQHRIDGRAEVTVRMHVVLVRSA
jgi:hypothetical protein